MKENKAPAFQFYPKDALDIKVLRMSDAAQGVYWRLLWNIWAHTKTQHSIADNNKYLAKILGLSGRRWRKYRDEIQVENDPLLIEENGFLISKRLRQEKEKQEVRRQQTKEAADVRWHKKPMQTHNQTDMQKPCPLSSSSSASSSSISNKKKNTLSGKPDLEAPVLYLNEKAKRNYDPKNKANQDLVKARYNEGRTLKDFQLVIDKKITDWLNDEKMMMYLRPSTLFNRTKFENYLNEPDSPGNLSWAEKRKRGE